MSTSPIYKPKKNDSNEGIKKLMHSMESAKKFYSKDTHHTPLKPSSKILDFFLRFIDAIDIYLYWPLINMLSSLQRPNITRLKENNDIKKLIKALQHKEPSVRMDAIEALCSIRDPGAVDPLIAALNDQDSAVRQKTTRALVRMDKQVVKPLIDLLSVELGEGDEINKSKRALEGMGPFAVKMQMSLQDEEVIHSSVRKDVAWILGELKDPRALKVLIAALEDTNAYVLISAAGALGKIKDVRAVGPLISILKYPNAIWADATVAALTTITGKGFGKDQGKWQEWWEQNK